MSTHGIQIAPSILAADFARLGDELKRMEDGGADLIHVDVMDGHFVPNITMGPFIVEAVRRATDLPIDAHLMITNPEKYAASFIDAGADFVVFHSEVTDDPRSLIESIRKGGARPGLAVNPPSPAERIEPWLDIIDMVLVMTVNPGFAGQGFMAGVMPKLAQISSWKRERDLSVLIEVDGGISVKTAPTVAANGGEVLVAGSAVFGADDPAAAVAAIRDAAGRAVVVRDASGRAIL
ncbi:ribulose-phosphate 3-epimerase [bacterium]|nr:ribulose-phosphate 3-epimerase [bacterium]